MVVIVAPCHNLAVCTLFSCYPRVLLGLARDRCKIQACRGYVVRVPRGAFGEFGTDISSDLGIRVSDSSADLRDLVAAMHLVEMRGWDEDRLVSIVRLDSKISVVRHLSVFADP